VKGFLIFLLMTLFLMTLSVLQEEQKILFPKTQNWIKAKKSIQMEKQFTDGNNICSIYSMGVVTPAGDTASFQLADYIALLGGKIAKERVYFSDPVKFAKAMGFMDTYLKKY